jgi:glycogen debranching enzyme
VRSLQPMLHDLVCVVRAPGCVLSAADGQIREPGVQGLLHGDHRVLSEAVLLVDGREPEPVAHHATGPGTARFTALLRWVGDPSADPIVRLDRFRTATADGMTERIRVSSAATRPVRLVMTLDLGCDLAPIDEVKSGRTGQPRLPATAVGGSTADTLSWRRDALAVTVSASDATVTAGRRPRVTWQIDLPPAASHELTWSVTVSDDTALLAAPVTAPQWQRPQVIAADRRIERLLARSLDDLESLRLVEVGESTGESLREPPGVQADAFLAAGVPWFLTLFGRDSLWAARMLLPLGTGLAASTLRVLARSQGHTVDTESGEAPGKIMHELRRGLSAIRGGRLPPVYYGTIDATLLWISLLHDAWRWGLPEREVHELVPALLGALRWLDAYADPDGDGFVEYVDTSGRGLANQGWKDSGDAVRFRDGSRAQPPIALVEVQGYAHRAALDAAALLDAFDLPGAERWRAYASKLADQFRSAFWVDGPLGAYPALALDHDKRPVDSLTSNIGHLLGTGILTAAESAQVAALLGAPALADGFGLRTMSTQDAGFNPLSYHCGSVWPHDTAIVIAGLAAEGHDEVAARLAEGVLAAAEAFGYRLPELYGGDRREDVAGPMPYPAACLPQAWSAAAAVTIVHAALGLRPDGSLRPLAGAPLGAITARGLQVGGRTVTVSVDAAGNGAVNGLSPAA